jgi:hypothetical protein
MRGYTINLTLLFYVWGAMIGPIVECDIYRGEPYNCLGRVFNFKLDSFDSCQHKYTVFVQPFLELNLAKPVDGQIGGRSNLWCHDTQDNDIQHNDTQLIALY